MCVWTLKKRLGIDPKNKHYELDQDTTAMRVTSRDAGQSQSGQQETASNQATEQVQEEQQDGVFL